MTSELQTLSREDSLALLATVPLGRLVFTQHALPVVVPVNFVLDGGEIVIRTGETSTLAAGLRGTVVAFEVDQFDTAHQSGWSVTVTGRAWEETDAGEVARLSELPLRPWAAGIRERFIKLSIEIVEGRQLGAVSA
jgi:nitroimidazol reductase NimA-like FMN-containing flavoprotein (pyridoxamine 5'-phosphate oxidase superfamily)